MAAYVSSAITVAIGAYFCALGLGAPVFPRTLRGRRWLALVGGIVAVAALANGIVHWRDRGKVAAMAAAEGIRARLALPLRVDEFTRLDDVRAAGDRLVYSYTIMNAETNAAERIVAEMRRRLAQSACTREDLRVVFAAGVTVEYRYALTSARQFEPIVLAPADCRR